MQVAFHPTGHRDGEFQFAPDPEGWTPCSPLEDFALTAGTFLLAVAPVLAVIAWWLS